ncbi:MAG: hypothetical protein ACLRMZ_11205 [Blautia marasmi]
MGLQSVRNSNLKLLGRIHTFEEFLESFRLAREAGFQNINLDLISPAGADKRVLAEELETAAKLSGTYLRIPADLGGRHPVL